MEGNALWFIKRTQHFYGFDEKYMMVYFDDILIYKPTKQAHFKQLKEALEVQRQEKLYANLKRRQRITNEFFLGNVVSASGIQVDESKLK